MEPPTHQHGRPPETQSEPRCVQAVHRRSPAEAVTGFRALGASAKASVPHYAPPPLTAPVFGKLSGWSFHQHLARCRGSRKTWSRARLPPPLPPPAGALAAGGPAHWALGQAMPRKAIAALARPISRSNGASSGETSARAAPPGVTAAVKKTQCSYVADPDNP